MDHTIKKSLENSTALSFLEDSNPPSPGITSDPPHPLQSVFTLLPSSRRQNSKNTTKCRQGITYNTLGGSVAILKKRRYCCAIFRIIIFLTALKKKSLLSKEVFYIILSISTWPIYKPSLPLCMLIFCLIFNYNFLHTTPPRQLSIPSFV